MGLRDIGGYKMKKSCENCYNNIMPRDGRILPMAVCLEHDPDYSDDMSKYWDANGKDCPEWMPKSKYRK
jgi:hypothetical protein